MYQVYLNRFVHNESLKCDRLKFQNDRKKPESCHPFHPEVCVCVCVLIKDTLRCYSHFIIVINVLKRDIKHWIANGRDDLLHILCVSCCSIGKRHGVRIGHRPL